MLGSKVIDDLPFSLSYRTGFEPCSPRAFFSSMLSQHFTSRPPWHLLSTSRKLSYYLQVKDLCYSHWKSEVEQEARTCYPRMSPSKVEHFVSALSRQTLPYLLFRLVMIRITFSYIVLLSKRDCLAWIRSRDLRSDSPGRSPWSHRG